MEKSEASRPPPPPLATVEEIQRRLLRPTPLHSDQSSISTIASRDNMTRLESSSQINIVKGSEFEGKRDDVSNKRRLEDYLDPFLLSTICAKIGGKRKRDQQGHVGMKVKDDFDFDMPAFKEVSRNENMSDQWRKRINEEAVDLSNNLDLIGDDEDDDEISCTPFRKFEVMALKQYQGG